MEKTYKKPLLLMKMKLVFTDSILYEGLWTVFLVLLRLCTSSDNSV